MRTLLLSAFCCLLIVVPLLAATYLIDVNSANPTYLQFCLSDAFNVSQRFSQVEIFTYDWDTDLEHPQRNWFNMTNYGGNCWYYGAPSVKVGLIFTPVSLRFNVQDGGKVTLNNVIRSLQSPQIINSTLVDQSATDPGLNVSIYGNATAFRAAATYFDPNNGACMLNPLPSAYSDMYAAIRVQDWSNSLVCGQCLRLCNATGYSVEVLVTDQCPFPNLCTRYHWLDISPGAFDKLSNGNKGWGLQQLTWRFVECTKLVENSKLLNMSYLFTDYSQNYGFELQVRNFKIGLQKVEIQSKTQLNWIVLNRTESNTWLYTTGSVLQCPCRLRLTSISGESVIDQDTINQDIGSLPKRPLALNGTVQFTTIPTGYATYDGQCIPQISQNGTDNGNSNTTQPKTSIVVLTSNTNRNATKSVSAARSIFTLDTLLFVIFTSLLSVWKVHIL